MTYKKEKKGEKENSRVIFKKWKKAEGPIKKEKRKKQNDL